MNDLEQVQAELIAKQKKEAKELGTPHYSDFGKSYGILYHDIRNVYVDRLFLNPYRPMTEITAEARAEIKKAWNTGYEGQANPIHNPFSTQPFKSRYCCIEDATPKRAWATNKESSLSLRAMWKWLNDWKEQPFRMEFLSPVFDKTIYSDIKKKADLVDLETDITAERLVIKEYRDNISEQLHLVRKVWKLKLSQGMRDMTRREAFWVAKMGQAFGLHNLNTINVDTIRYYAFMYSVSEAYNEYFVNSPKWDTTKLDHNVLVFSSLDSHIDNPNDPNRVEVEWALARDLGQVGSRDKWLEGLTATEELPYEVHAYIRLHRMADDYYRYGANRLETLLANDKTFGQGKVWLKENSDLLRFALRKLMANSDFTNDDVTTDTPLGKPVSVDELNAETLEINSILNVLSDDKNKEVLDRLGVEFHEIDWFNNNSNTEGGNEYEKEK